MSDVEKIEVIGTIKDGIAIGTRNIGPILVNFLLWILTIWIPYLNVGTTIGLSVGIVSKASKGESISFTEIFNPIYRKYMGEYFLVCGLVSLGISVGMAFFIIPGIIIAISWCFAALITVDKGKNPSEAITLSNNATYGNKGRMFGILFLIFLAFCILVGIFALIPVLGIILIIVLYFCFMLVCIGVIAALYKQLTENI